MSEYNEDGGVRAEIQPWKNSLSLKRTQLVELLLKPVLAALLLDEESCEPEDEKYEKGQRLQQEAWVVE